MQCPYCKRTNTRVVQTFMAQDAFGEFVRRRRAYSSSRADACSPPTKSGRMLTTPAPGALHSATWPLRYTDNRPGTPSMLSARKASG